MDIKLFITDIDGVWTDGGMYYDQSGNEWKKFNTSDSAGVLFLKSVGIPVAIITGETTKIVEKRANKLQVDFLYQGVKNKLFIAQNLCHQLSLTLSQVAFIGDDINDILLLRKAGLSAAPMNAPAYVKKEVHWEIPVNGGNGAFRFFVEKYLSENSLLDQAIELYLQNLEIEQ